MEELNREAVQEREKRASGNLLSHWMLRTAEGAALVDQYLNECAVSGAVRCTVAFRRFRFDSCRSGIDTSTCKVHVGECCRGEY
ncbi:unnamed protein product [Hydatigera taeniaeformis]|uniref:Uncharacterized protein n=1 Tax=Hydatigena taeniaeformis TaxID=6205 RepID=A0A3P7EGA9_HYDTA|nr:unnamed protein product [Hydatigera taeniaeformis]